MSIPYRFEDSNTERSAADKMLADLGLTEAIMAARQANRGDKSHGLTGIGDAGSPSQNPLGVGPVPSPTYVQPNPAPATTVAVPPRNSNPMRVSATGNYNQPNVITPASRAGVTPTRLNPMGL